MLISSEFELIEAEHAFATILNVPVKDIGFEEDPSLLLQLPFLPKELGQLRVLLYAKDIRDVRIGMSDNVYMHFVFIEYVTS